MKKKIKNKLNKTIVTVLALTMLAPYNIQVRAVVSSEDTTPTTGEVQGVDGSAPVYNEDFTGNNQNQPQPTLPTIDLGEREELKPTPQPEPKPIENEPKEKPIENEPVVDLGEREELKPTPKPQPQPKEEKPKTENTKPTNTEKTDSKPKPQPKPQPKQDKPRQDTTPTADGVNRIVPKVDERIENERKEMTQEDLGLDSEEIRRKEEELRKELEEERRRRDEEASLRGQFKYNFTYARPLEEEKERLNEKRTNILAMVDSGDSYMMNKLFFGVNYGRVENDITYYESLSPIMHNTRTGTKSQYITRGELADMYNSIYKINHRADYPVTLAFLDTANTIFEEPVSNMLQLGVVSRDDLMIYGAYDMVTWGEMKDTLNKFETVLNKGSNNQQDPRMQKEFENRFKHIYGFGVKDSAYVPKSFIVGVIRELLFDEIVKYNNN